MRKLNNKGFAISTLIYGLAIMAIMIVAILMATMSQTRSNTRNLVKSIEDDLNRFSRTETAFKPIGSGIIAQEYIVPASGWYRIELWGSQGGGNGGRGAYTGGTLELTEGDILYFYVGKQKSSGGGYASEVRAVPGDYTDDISYETTIMAAAGGGSAATAWGGTLNGYDDKMNSEGGLIRVQGSTIDFALISTSDTSNTTNGTLVGYSKNYAVSTATPETALNHYVPSPEGSNGGGDGYFSSNNSSAGGTSFIAGYAGCHGISKGKISVNARVDYYEHLYVEDQTVVTPTYSNTLTSKYTFIDGIMLPGVKAGDGYAKIERIKPKTDASSTLPKANGKLNGVTQIRSCTSQSGASWNKIVATSKGTSQELTGTPSEGCVTVSLGSAKDLDEIAVFHGDSGKDYKNDTIEVNNSNGWQYIKNTGSGTTLSETETTSGYRVSAYQYDTTGPLPSKGYYIIQPVLSENKVLTASETAETDANPLTIEYYTGESRQRWLIELITDKTVSTGYNANNPNTYEYKIVDLARYNAMAISQDENKAFNVVSAMEKFNEKARNEPSIWKIRPVGNGTYTIETAVPSSNNTTGYLIAQTNKTLTEKYNQVLIGRKNKNTARFKLIKVDYGSE